MKIGVLALQGAFIEHINVMKKLGADTFEIREKKDLQQDFDGIILPGGESTTISKLLKDLNMFDELKKLIENGLPTFGTCAGLILLAKNISNEEKSHLGTLNVTVKRNAYGRQLGSFETQENFDKDKIPMTFIRAPYIEKCNKDVEILSIVDGKIVAVMQDNQLATAFHPELTDNTKVHEKFLEIIKNKKDD